MGYWPGRLAQLCKTKKIERSEPASQFAEGAEQFQLVKKREKGFLEVGLDESMTHNKFATLTLGELLRIENSS